MDFSEKLNRLFELTHAKGRELAAAMNVTPPQISKMRRGLRGLPKDREAAAVLARFFARRCAGDLQRDALARLLRSSQLRSLTDEQSLTEALLDWLSGGEDPDEYAARRADRCPRQFGSRSDGGGSREPDGGGRLLSSGQSGFLAYYGGQGRRAAVRAFFRDLLRRGRPCAIDILTDENGSWITDDPAFSGESRELMVRLTEQGCRFRRISGPISDMEQAFESLDRWFPLYMTGKAVPYCCKRMRDPLSRVTLFVVPEVSALFSFSVGGVLRPDSVTFFTGDLNTVRAMSAEFGHYLALCEPILHVYSADDSPRRLRECMLAYESCAGSCIQRSDSLSCITLPRNAAAALCAGCAPAEREAFLSSFSRRQEKFLENLERYSFTDIIRLEDPAAVAGGTAPIPGAYALGGRPQHYTPQGYLEHLRSVLSLLERRENYHAVLRGPGDRDATAVCVKEGRCAILAREVSPFSICEVSERSLVDALAEYLRRQLPSEGGGQARRRAVMGELRALIARLERALSAGPLA